MSTTAELLATGQQYYLPVYRPREVILERGQGARVWDRKARSTSTCPPASRSAAWATTIPTWSRR